MANLIAYIPVLNNRHLEWFRKHPVSTLYLIHQNLAESLLPRLSRNVGSLPTWVMAKMLRELSCPPSVREVVVLDSETVENLDLTKHFVVADEDVCRILVEKYLPSGTVSFEVTWARWDMSAVKRRSPLMQGVEVVSGQEARMQIARNEAVRSPDWWRQIGAALYLNGTLIASARNDHFPTEYATDIMGDPRMNFEAGQPGKYVSFHAEKTVIIKSGRQGIPTEGADLYTTVFPCEDCARAIVVAGVAHVYFEEGYSALDAQEILQNAGIRISQVVKDPVIAE